MTELIPPHGGGDLNPLLLQGAALRAERERAETLPRVNITSREAGDLIMMGIGGFTPLTGFMGHDDWAGVCDGMHTASGLFWPIPITLSADQGTADSIKLGSDVALFDPDRNTILATMTVTEKYRIDKAHECRQVFRTTDESHPGVAKVVAQGEVNLAGPVKVLGQGEFPDVYGSLFMTPTQTRVEFERRGWKTVTAFQTRNPMHRSHEHLAKIALEITDGVMIHSLLGKLKPGDFPAEVRQKAIAELIKHYFVKNTVIQSGYPLDMRYAGPREALLHAVFRQNYGCAYLVVGRDHAGVGDFYGPFDSQKIFAQVPEGDLLTKPLTIDWTFYCYGCGGMASARNCPHDDSQRVLVSGTKLRKLLSESGEVPDNFSRPEVLDILRGYYADIPVDQRVKIELKGHSAATAVQR